MDQSTSHPWVSWLSIVLIDLLLAGDNALVIAMAVRRLPRRERFIGTLCGAGAAVLLRVVLTIVAARLLTLSFVKLIGGVLVIWIALKVFVDASSEDPEDRAPRRLIQAIWLIIVADLSMSLDNVLAVAGASKGSTTLIVFGLLLSIPLVIFSSNLLSVLMDRYPVIVYAGSAILAKVGAEMILTDPLVERHWVPGSVIRYICEASAVLAVLATGYLLTRRRRRSERATL